VGGQVFSASRDDIHPSVGDNMLKLILKIQNVKRVKHSFGCFPFHAAFSLGLLFDPKVKYAAFYPGRENSVRISDPI
jgi:hypothetical protein